MSHSLLLILISVSIISHFNIQIVYSIPTYSTNFTSYRVFIFNGTLIIDKNISPEDELKLFSKNDESQLDLKIISALNSSKTFESEKSVEQLVECRVCIRECTNGRCTCKDDEGDNFLNYGTCKGNLGETCNKESDCFDHMRCYKNSCECTDGYINVYKHCLQKVNIGQFCESDKQCPNNAECVENESYEKKCECKVNYRENGFNQCVNDYSNKTALQIYKITMIFASCCLAVILIIFLICILRKTYCPARRPEHLTLDNSIPDIFTMYPDIANFDHPLPNAPPYEKPPTYDETLTLIRAEFGVPPPDYVSRSRMASLENSPNLNSSRITIGLPILMTVPTSSSHNPSTSINNQERDNDSLSSHNSTSPLDPNDNPVAGPSGYNSNINLRQTNNANVNSNNGVINHAFTRDLDLDHNHII